MALSQYQEELSRLASFASWPPTSNVSCLSFAKSGFYYGGSELKIVCWHCGNGIDVCSNGDNVKLRHKLLKPDCPVVTNSISVDIPPLLPDLNIHPRNTTETDFGEKQSESLHDILKTVCTRATRKGIFERQVLKISFSDPDFDLLRRELLRLKSFQNWPTANHAVPDELAHAGFFYTGTGDKVQCAFCRNYYECWRPGDNPLAVHQQQFPDCAFIREDHKVSANVPKNNDLLECEVQLIRDSQCAINSRRVETLYSTDHAPLEAETYESGRLSECVQRPKNPDMSDEVRRKETFNRSEVVIPKGQTPETLAKAGFYYIGPSDYCKCFFCGGGLKNWQEDDDPWSEHARWYPRCGHVKSKQGQGFIVTTQNAKSARLQQMQPRLDGTSLLTSNNNLTNGENFVVNGLIEEKSRGNQSTASTSSSSSSSASQSLNLSLSENKKTGSKQEAKLKDATVGSKMQREVTEASSLDQHQQSVQSSSKNKKKSKKKKKAVNANSEAQSSMEKPTVAPQEETGGLEVNELQQKQENLAETPEYIERILTEENNLLKEARTCKICMEKDVNIVFLPCGHLVCCQDCAPELRLCCICRAMIRGTVKTFLA